DGSTRSLDGPTCEAVSEAAALIVALALHPTPAPAASDSTQDKPKPPTWTPSPDYYRNLAALTLSGDSGTAPTPTLGGEFSIRTTLGPIRWEPFGGYYARRRGTHPTDNNMGAQFTFATGGLRGCYDVVGAAASISPCVAAGLDWMKASGFGA